MCINQKTKASTKQGLPLMTSTGSIFSSVTALFLLVCSEMQTYIESHLWPTVHWYTENTTRSISFVCQLFKKKRTNKHSVYPAICVLVETIVLYTIFLTAGDLSCMLVLIQYALFIDKDEFIID